MKGVAVHCTCSLGPPTSIAPPHGPTCKVARACCYCGQIHILAEGDVAGVNLHRT